MKNDFVFYTRRNHEIKVSIYGIEHIAARPAIIYVHGFKGFKDWGFVPYVGEFFASHGYCLITFNFSHNGIGTDPLAMSETGLFASNTFSLEASELTQIIEAFHFGFFAPDVSKDLFLLGHSRGGGIALVTARKDPSVKAVATWASVARFDRYSKRQKADWKKRGFFEVTNQRTKQVMRLNVTLLEDIEKHKSGILSIRRAMRTLNRPVLIIHGEQDLAVKVDEAEALYEWGNPDLTTIYRIPATGHTFGISHPFEKSTPEFELILKSTLDFFNTIK
ncbi:MAG: alpha/beta hydrolase [Ignavibacteriales bacterium]|nr:alpha/beta hydrolase [Ignavibacteriales bacterium]